KGAQLRQPAVTVLPGANPPRDSPTRAKSTRSADCAPWPNSTQVHSSFSGRLLSEIAPSSTLSSVSTGAAAAAPAPSTAQAAAAAPTAATRNPVDIIVVLLIRWIPSPRQLPLRGIRNRTAVCDHGDARAGHVTHGLYTSDDAPAVEENFSWHAPPSRPSSPLRAMPSTPSSPSAMASTR